MRLEGEKILVAFEFARKSLRWKAFSGEQKVSQKVCNVSRAFGNTVGKTQCKMAGQENVLRCGLQNKSLCEQRYVFRYKYRFEFGLIHPSNQATNQPNNAHTHLFNTGGILLHCDLLCGALKAEEGFDVHAGGLLKTGPVFILRVNLRRDRSNVRVKQLTHKHVCLNKRETAGREQHRPCSSSARRRWLCWRRTRCTPLCAEFSLFGPKSSSGWNTSSPLLLSVHTAMCHSHNQGTGYYEVLKAKWNTHKMKEEFT